MRAKIWSAIFLGSVAAVALWLSGPPAPFRASQGEGVTREGSPNPEEERLKRITFLKTVIANPALETEDRKKVVNAILELGEMKAVEAGKELAEKIDFHVSADGIVWHHEPPTTAEVYPAVKALIEIGEPALPFVLDAVAEKDRSEDFLGNCIYIFSRVIRKERRFERDATVWNHARAEIYYAFDAHIKSAERLRRLADRIGPNP